MMWWIAAALAAPARLGTGPVVADGVTEAEVRIRLDPGARAPKVTAAEGRVLSTAVGADGALVVRWVPPLRAEPGAVALRWTVGKESVSVEVPVVPAPTGRWVAEVQPPVVAAGQTATVIVRAEGSSPTPLDRRRVVARASAGTIEGWSRQADGSWKATYTAPKLANPQVVALAFADADSPDRVVGAAVVRVAVQRTVTVDAPAGQKALLQLGATASPSVPVKGGKATFDLLLDPAVLTATAVITRADGATEERVVQLPIGAPALAFVPGPGAAVLGDPWVLRLFAFGAEGAPWVTQPPRVAAVGATVRSVTLDGAAWRIELADPVAGEVRVVAGVATAEVTEVRQALALPSWTLAVEPALLPATGKLAPKVTATGPAGPTWSWAQGAPAPGTRPDALVVTAALADGAPALAVAVGPTAPPSTWMPADVDLYLDHPVLRADGQSALGVRVAVVDPAGLPIADAEVELTVDGGGARLPASRVRTDALGVARALITAGSTEGLVTLRATAGGRWTEIPFLQVLAAGGPDVSPEPTGPAARWMQAVTEQTWWREGAAPQRPPVTTGATAPSLPPAPALTAAPAAPAPSAPRPPKAARPAAAATAADAIRQVGVSLTDSHGGYAFAGDGAALVTEAVYKTPLPGFFGAQADVDWTVGGGSWGALAVVGQLHGRLELYAVDGTRGASPQIDAAAGARWRPNLSGAWRPDAGVLIAVPTAVAFRYQPDGGSEGFTQARVGLRPDVGVMWTTAALQIRLGGGATLGPGPVAAGLGATAVFPPVGPIRPRASLGLDWRGWEVSRGSSSGTLSQTRAVIGVGAVFGD
jgi:hypothetical protein